jgi:23S rRNA pseudouridine1911/1915/1917 synthase
VKKTGGKKMNNIVFIVEVKDNGDRVDKFLASKINNISRSYLQKLIKDKRVLLNDKIVKNSTKISIGDELIVYIPPTEEYKLEPYDVELDIIYEDDAIIVINKAAGIVVHPAHGNRNHTLVNALLAYTDELSGINGVKRPGIVHRLDKDTSGAIVIAKKNDSYQELIKQFKERKIRKIYRAIVKGRVPYEKGKIDAPIGRSLNNRKKMAVTGKNSKRAISTFNVLDYLGNYTYIEVKLETGRTHQIRVHLSYMGFPILGDKKYSSAKDNLGVKRQLLHAYELGLFHPVTGKWMEFIAPLPDDFKDALIKLGNKA